MVGDCQGATPTSDKARRPTPTTGDRGRRWRWIGKEGPASKVLSGTYENVAEVGTGRVALSMQRLRQGGILQRSIVPIYFHSFVFHVSSSKHHVSISAVAQKVNLGNLGVRNAMRPNERVAVFGRPVMCDSRR